VKKVVSLICLLLLACCGLYACKSDTASSNETTKNEVCGPFSDWSKSAYVLPYAVSQEYVVNQTNCSGYGHSDYWLYGYDFIMDIGTPVHSMRSGEVVYTNDGVEDGVRIDTNFILIEHDDGTIALYSHLTNNGVLVIKGQLVDKGDLVGLSGDTGNTGGLPHLHVSLHPCIGLPGVKNVPLGKCDSQPFNFANTEANPNGLVARKKYLALPF